MDHEILVAAGLMAAGIGLAIWLAAIVRRGRSRPYGTCGFSSEDFEKMTMPAHERLARTLANMHGYSRGGTANDRRIADAELLAGVAHNGHPVWAIIMWIAVRIGGHPYFPFSWRWGYRHQYPCRYAERTN